MIAQLKQKRGLEYRCHTLYEDKVLVELRSTKSVDKYEVSLDKLGLEKYYQADNVIAGKILLGAIIAIFLFTWVIYIVDHSDISPEEFILANIAYVFLGCVAYFKPHKDNIYLQGGKKNLVFYRNIPNEAEVLRFIDLVIATRNEGLRKKYTGFDEDTDEMEYRSRLLWLRDQKIINAEQYENYLEIFKLSRLL